MRNNTTYNRALHRALGAFHVKDDRLNKVHLRNLGGT